MGEEERPLLAEVYPALVTYLEASLIAEGESSLSRAVRQLRFYGWCKCRLSCTYLQTAAAGSRDNAWIHLEDEDPRVWLQLDRGHTSFAGMEICDFALGPALELDPLRPAHIS
jgi:hypothetical protein